VTHDAFVVPLKQFDLAKERLRAGGASDVTALARDLALDVLRSCAPRHVIVVSESESISTFARERGAEVWHSTATSLNEAVQGAYGGLSDRFDRLLIVHGDLRAPAGLGSFDPSPGVTIVTDHHGRGTNVLALPTGLDFHFAYGIDSATLHRREAERLGVEVTLIEDSPWRFDVDEPSDLTE
jgi:2-phospho-L-lactate guanylyltransferase